MQLSEFEMQWLHIARRVTHLYRDYARYYANDARGPVVRSNIPCHLAFEYDSIREQLKTTMNDLTSDRHTMVTDVCLSYISYYYWLNDSSDRYQWNSVVKKMLTDRMLSNSNYGNLLHQLEDVLPGILDEPTSTWGDQILLERVRLS